MNTAAETTEVQVIFQASICRYPGYFPPVIQRKIPSAIAGKPASKPADPELQKAYSQIADRLSSIFGAKVKVDRNEKGKGKISLVFSSDEELENILMVIDSIKN
jgi:ParB family chromosome partitioning protein